MSICKILITSDHIFDPKGYINEPKTVLHGWEVVPFFQKGFLPIPLPAIKIDKAHAEEYAKMADLLVFTGGGDVNPYLYGEEVMFHNVERYTFRDDNEMQLLEAAIRFKKPIFGICRGMQLINVFFGGTLYQNVKEQTDTKLVHTVNQRNQMAHKIFIEKNSFLYDAYQSTESWVNSYHFQAIKKLGKNLKAVAKSSDGIIEAVQHKSLPIFGVEWHPEISYPVDTNTQKLIHLILETTKHYKKNSDD